MLRVISLREVTLAYDNMEKDLFKELSCFELNYNIFLGDKFLIETGDTAFDISGRLLRASRHDYFCISLIYGGLVSQKIDIDALTNVQAILLQEKGEIWKRASETGRRFVDLYFSQRYLDSENLPWNDYLNRVFGNSIIQLTDGEMSDFHSYFSLILYEYQKNDSRAPTVIANLLMIIFKMIIECGEYTTMPKDEPVARTAYFQFKALIEQRFKERHDVQTYAEELNMTKDMLGKVVKDTVNKTPKQVIDERLIAEAKRLLAWTKISNKNIAYDLGFESDSYFNRYFKKHCHQTPLSFRQQIQNDEKNH
jgi:AraC-like DNA-binding protein